MRLATIIVCMTVAGGAVAEAQALSMDRLTPPAATASDRHAYDVASWATVAVGQALDTRASWDAEDRRAAFVMQGARLGLVVTSSLVVKAIVHRQRPLNGPHDSFWSQHTALAFSTLGGPRLSLTVPLAVSTGGMRVLAGKHYLTDVLAGAGVGAALSQLR